MNTTQGVAGIGLMAEYAEIGPALEQALLRVARSGRYVLGPEVEAFEEELADWLGVAHCVGVNSGTDALIIGLRAAGVEPGDEVITSGFSFFATAEAVLHCGARLVLADIDPRTFNLDPQAVAELITPRTRAIMPVHLYGQPADMDALGELARQHGLSIVEDAAQAIGASWDGRRAGALGDAGALSFYPSKNLAAAGDAGMLTTDSPAVAQTARMLRDHGSSARYHHELTGYNSRMDAFQGAVLRCKLPHLEEWNARRQACAARYREALQDLPGCTLPSEAAPAGHVYHQFAVRIPAARRDAVLGGLRERGVEARLFYPAPLHEVPALKGSDMNCGPLKECRRAAREVVCLPITPWLTPEEIDYAADCLRRVLG